jgi:Fic family protein
MTDQDDIKKQRQTPFNPPKLPVKIDYEALATDLSRAHAALARLDETLNHIENPTLLEKTFHTREAVLSSRIEGTQASFEEVFEQEAQVEEYDENATEKTRDIREIQNYRDTLDRGKAYIDKGKPLSENVVKELHTILLNSVRGCNKAPGEFRRQKVHVGPQDGDVEKARYTPPLPRNIADLYSNFDRYVNIPENEDDPLVQIAIAHYQFEAIHPFEDGNGRIGRLIILLFLYDRGIISPPLLNLSEYFEKHRRDYYDYLADVSFRGNWAGWIQFFLNGLEEQAQEARDRTQRVLTLHREYEERVREFHSVYALNLLREMFAQPIFTTRSIRKPAGIDNPQTLANLLNRFKEAGIIEKLSPERKRNKIYVFRQLLQLLEGNE